jgi:hypothetical protein
LRATAIRWPPPRCCRFDLGQCAIPIISIELGIIITTFANPVEICGVDLVCVECQEVGQVEGALLLSAATIAGVAIIDIGVLAFNGISINLVYRFLILLSSSSSMSLAMAPVTTAAATAKTTIMMRMTTTMMAILRILHRRNYSMTIIATPTLSKRHWNILRSIIGVSLVGGKNSLYSDGTTLLLAPFSAESVPAPAASPWFREGCLAGTDVIAIPSQTPPQAEFERVQELVSVKRRWRDAKKAIELFKFILINRQESLREVLYQANYLSQIVISAGLPTDLLHICQSVDLSIAQFLRFVKIGNQQIDSRQIDRFDFVWTR